MKRLAVVALVVGSISAWAGQAVHDLVSVKILVHDYAGLGEQRLNQALEEAARVFLKAGIEPVWCVGKAARDKCFATERSSGRPVFMLNLLDPAMAAKEPMILNQAGFARGRLAFIRVSWVHELVRTRKFEEKVVLGYVIAHELGHVLLGPNAHVRGSIMTANLGVQELAKAHRGTLRFSQNEAERMRNRLSR